MSKLQGSLTIFVPGEPVPKGRPRMTQTGHVYTPPKTHHYEYEIGLLGLTAMRGHPPFENYLHVDILVILPIPPSWSEKRKKDALECRTFPVGKGDLDNYVKSALDGLNKIVFKDDGQICSLSARKVYGEITGLHIIIETID